MEKREGGYFITEDEVRNAGRILGYIAAGVLALRLIRVILRPLPNGRKI